MPRSRSLPPQASRGWHRAIPDLLGSLRLSVGVTASLVLLVGCEAAELPTEAPGPPAEARGGPMADVPTLYTFDGGPAFDLEALPNGNILVPVTVATGVPGPTTIWEIRTQGGGGERELVTFTTPEGAPINGLTAMGRGSLLATRGALDLAEHAAVLHVTPGGARLLGDIEEFEQLNDPDRFAIADWKDPACAAASGEFTPGPQSNPYHLTATSGGTAVVADAAGNTLLRVERNGDIELVALFTPPAEGGGASDDPADWLEFPFPDARDGTCYVQPVPTAVKIGPDGGIYVGELTGIDFTAAVLTPQGASRVWPVTPPPPAPGGIPLAGGTVNRCDLDAGVCEVAQVGSETLEGLTMPAAIAFDKWGHLWLLDNNLTTPTVRRLD